MPHFTPAQRQYIRKRTKVHDLDPSKTVCGARIPQHGYVYEAEDSADDCYKCKEWRATMELNINKSMRGAK